MAELGIVDALARLQLAARRSGYEIAVTDAPSDLIELIELAGLCDVLGVGPERVGSGERRSVAEG